MNNLCFGLMLSVIASLTLTSSPSLANTDEITVVKMCAFDPIGGNGPIYQAFVDYQTAALAWGAKLELTPYTDERVASEDFKSGVCDVVNLSGIRARSYNHFTGTLDSIGSIPTYEHLRTTLSTLATKKAAKFMVSGGYEVAGILPIGAIYPFVIDKSINSPEKLAGKRIAVLDNAPEMQYMVAQSGMTPVSSTITNVFSKFNNHTVDIAGGPALAFEPMELHKGMEPNGGIINYPMLQATLQLITRPTALPLGFGQKSRSYISRNFEDALKIIIEAEQRIPEKYWIDIENVNEDDWNEVFRQNRIALRDKGIYNGKALTILRKIRCKMDASRSECTALDKE
ncbi:hypothetical protein A9Q81_12790 [Gammaproteobacteria bacterium 42_54_T18]|mgnify:CR=1 FL=1|nr:hypothetical protein A9Q81_12790 [Gammaproteobacteria bacterium 42_54_T18]